MPAERTGEDLWAVGPSDVTQPETTLTKVAASTIFHIPVAPHRPEANSPTANAGLYGKNVVKVAAWGKSRCTAHGRSQYATPSISTKCRPHQ